MRLMSLVSNLCGKIILKHIESSEIDLLPKIVSWVTKIIPYITEFKVAVTICNFYKIDLNLITANPTIIDIYSYKFSQSNKIYQYNKSILDKFLSYFEAYDMGMTTLAIIKNNIEEGTIESFAISGNVSPIELPNPFIDYPQVKLKLISLSYKSGVFKR